MDGFTLIAQTPSFNALYQAAIEQAEIRKKIEEAENGRTLAQPLKVLDMGGGTGTLGSILAKKFGSWVDYVNLDADSKTLQQSGGRQVWGSYLQIPTVLPQERFDYVFGLNINNPPTISEAALRIVRRQDPFLAQELAQADRAQRGLYERILLLNAALATAADGRLVRAGVLPPDSLRGITEQLNSRGMKRTADVPVAFDQADARQLVHHDIGDEARNLTPQQLDYATQLCMQNFRVATFDREKPMDDKRALGNLTEMLEKYSLNASLMKAQERFWER